MSAATTAAPAAPLLVEILTEELPPRALEQLGRSFGGAIAKGLAEAGLADDGTPAAAPRIWSTPRRLGVTVPSVRDRAPARVQRTKGPSVSVGLDAAGKPSVALLKWALKQGVDLEREGLGALTREDDGRQTCFFHERTVEGATLAESIESIIAKAIAQLPIPKRMNYQLADGTTTVSFVRPAHRLVVLHGSAILPCTALGLEAGRVTSGHRFLGDARIEIAHADDYASLLRTRGRVVPAFDERRRMIDEALAREAAALDARLGASDEDASRNAALLDEVTALVEWPKVLVGRFDDAFLAVPPECLILTMRTNQKYFPLFRADGALLPRFLIVSNMPIDDTSRIVDGNERVVRPRLADARFFYEQDRKAPLESRVAELAKVVYHARLGSQAQRTTRVEALAARIAARLGVDPGDATRAARLAKADLLTGMVGEFPELQGIMGRYYARHDGEPAEVADAIAEHYQPRFAGDALPVTATGTVLALADKLETLAGIWGIGALPSGDRDPFALRRHALGVVRLLFEKRLPLALSSLLADAFAGLAGVDGIDAAASLPGLNGFVVERLRGYLRERGSDAADVDAVLAAGADRLDLVERRLQAVRRFRELPEADALAAANKRIANILRKAGSTAEPDGADAAPSDALGRTVDASRLVDAAEIRLHDELLALTARLVPLVEREDHEATLLALASLRAPVDDFFEKVMVNADDPAVRANRLALLAALHAQMNRVADLSRLHS
ncbi:MAG: glycine--tRNA ligase subunit beta [Lautropia sp.]